ncbi:DDE-type integrase/transposase/recombinase [Tessaracoccus palaemonis]|uniref:DDE-type integrase/transposase/recombinase n=1 Tax=Tessaracoccus palaemonis TaxID=2829499 RepID=A0ABX8SJW3_9ACTN|nr:DDE-type integrase/transposase/recombinase [Tessaracoccus palaemonis]QXT62433.1 DDE-type integrase/transposase/recombinase [Tessaracoccus palaemonis]
MAARIDARVRQRIINFPDSPRRGEVTRFCREHGISRAEFYKVRSRAADEGKLAAVAPRQPIARSVARRTSDEIETIALQVRAQLKREGWDHGPLSVAAAMRRQGIDPPSRATLARIFTRHGVVRPEPAKRPRASYRRFRYPDPNGCWQLDGVEIVLDDEAGSRRCVLQVEDDHSRFILASHVALSETSQAAITVVAAAIGHHGAPARFLTDNGTAFNQSRRGRTSQLEGFLRRQGVEPITGRPGKPTTQGKSERLHQTFHTFLDAHRPIRTQDRLAELADQFAQYYNTQRAHQALDPDQTPADAYQSRPKALPGPPTPPPPATPATGRRTVKSGITRRLKGERPVTDANDARWADRLVSRNGRIHICNAKIYVGARHIGETLHIMFNATTIEIFDINGVLIGTTPHPGPVTTGTTRLLTISPRTPPVTVRHNRQQATETQPSTKH